MAAKNFIVEVSFNTITKNISAILAIIGISFIMTGWMPHALAG